MNYYFGTIDQKLDSRYVNHVLVCILLKQHRIEDEAITTTKCSSCNNNNRVESMPISYDEVYKFDLIMIQSVELF